jgi:hypothetical protein
MSSSELLCSAEIIMMKPAQEAATPPEETPKRLDDTILKELKMLQGLTSTGSQTASTMPKTETRPSSAHRPVAETSFMQPVIGRDIEQSTYERIAEERRRRIAEWLEKSGANEPEEAPDPGPSHRPKHHREGRRQSDASTVQVYKSTMTTGHSSSTSARKRIVRRLSEPMMSFLGSFHISKSGRMSKVFSFFYEKQDSKGSLSNAFSRLSNLLPNIREVLAQALLEATAVNLEQELQPEDYTTCKKVRRVSNRISFPHRHDCAVHYKPHIIIIMLLKKRVVHVLLHSARTPAP